MNREQLIINNKKRIKKDRKFSCEGAVIFLFVLLLAAGCELAPRSKPALSPLSDRPNAGTWYQIFVGAFFDSNNDGIGDLRGITIKLDYLNDSHTLRHAENMAAFGECNESLHVNGIWLTPIHPSPSYHKYDVIDYKAIDPQFGTMEDFRELLKECHKRGVKLAIDMVMNHTSERHEWFQKALAEVRSGKPGRYAGYYHFYNGPIPPQRESVEFAEWNWQWDGYWQDGKWIPDMGIRNRFYRCWGKAMDGVWWEGSFWTGMPDLNWDSHHLREEFEDIIKFWIGEGLDGYRLDAVHYFYDWVDIGQYEYGVVPHYTHEKNIDMLKWFTESCYAINPNVYLIGECWRDNDIIETYFRSGMNFFQFGAINKIVEVLNAHNTGRKDQAGRDFANYLAYYDLRIRGKSKNALLASFLSNHDKDRPFYWVGGEDGRWEDLPHPTMRGDDRRRFAASLNLLTPGTPYIYYGEEIGLMHNLTDYQAGAGQNDFHEFTNATDKRARDDSDRRGPMWWSNRSNFVGNTIAPETRRWSEKALRSRYGNGVEEQLNEEYSLLNHYIRVGNLKSRYPFIAWGKMELVRPVQVEGNGEWVNAYIAAWRVIDTWEKSPTFGKSVVIAHNTSYDTDQEFWLPRTVYWIDGVSSRGIDWRPSITDKDVMVDDSLQSARVVHLPPYYSAIIGEYPDWETGR